MNLHEYQAKDVLRTFNVPCPEGEVVSSPDEAAAVYARLGNDRAVVKAQVHAGGRGLAGGVRIIDNKQGLVDVVKELIGTRLVTAQTTDEGQPISQVLIEAPCMIEKEFYLGLVVDRAQKKTVVMCSAQGGVDIETTAHESPNSISQFTVDPTLGVMPYQCRNMANSLGLTAQQTKQFTDLLVKLGQCFVTKDLSMLEINPLVINANGELICLDAKMAVDSNALYRQPALRAMRDPSQEDERENRAMMSELNYISLDGDIGCMVNGAGLAMATMDLIKLHGGHPANFLDVGGGATKERVAEAFKIILSDQQVKVVMVNIFGGIVRCDLIADGIIGAIAEVNVDLPVVVRLEGNNAELGRKKLAESGLNVIAAESFDHAAQQAVIEAKKGSHRV